MKIHSIIAYGLMPASLDAVVGSKCPMKNSISFKNSALF